MRFSALPCVLLACICPAMAAGISVEISPLNDLRAEGPCHPVEIRLRSQLEASVAAVEIRAADGGPRMIFPLAVAPGGLGLLRCDLPADGLSQSFVVTALDRYAKGPDAQPGKPLAQVSSTVNWPANLPGDAGVLPSLYTALQPAQAAWPEEFRRQLLVVLAGYCVLAGFTLVPRGRLARALLAATAALGGTGMVAWMLLQAAPPTVETSRYQLIQRHADNSLTSRSFIVLAGRRSAKGRVTAEQAPAGTIWCIYPDHAGRRADNTTLLRPAEPSFSGGSPAEYALQAGQVRILGTLQFLRPAQIRESSPPAMVARLNGDSLIVRPVSGHVPASLLIIENRCFEVGAMAAGAERRLSTDDSILLDNLPARGRPEGFDDSSMRLLTWWLKEGRRGSRAFLVYPARQQDISQLRVSAITLDLPASVQAAIQAGGG